MYYNVFMFHCMYTTDLKNRTGLRGTLGFLVLQELLLFFMRYFSNFAASVQYFVLSIQTVSVFIEFSPRYCGISQFSPSYCGSEYPPPPPPECPPHWTSIVGKLKQMVAILEWPSEEYSGITEKNDNWHFILKVDEGNIGCILIIFGSLTVWFVYKHQALGRLFKIAVNWLQNRLITNNELLDPVLFFRSVMYTPPVFSLWHHHCDTPSNEGTRNI